MKFLLEFNDFTSAKWSLSEEESNDIKESLIDFLYSEDLDGDYEILECGLAINFDHGELSALSPRQTLGMYDINYNNAIGILNNFKSIIDDDQIMSLNNILKTKGKFVVLRNMPGVFRIIITTKEIIKNLMYCLKFATVLNNIEFMENSIISKWSSVVSIKEGRKKSFNETSITIVPKEQNESGMRVDFKLSKLDDNVTFEVEATATGVFSETYKIINKYCNDINKKNLSFEYKMNNTLDENELDLSNWLDKNILIYFKNSKIENRDKFINRLNEIKTDFKIEINRESTLPYPLNSVCELDVYIKYKNDERSLFFYFDTVTKEIRIKNERLNTILETNLEDLYDDLLLLFIEKNKNLK